MGFTIKRDRINLINHIGFPRNILENVWLYTSAIHTSLKYKYILNKN